MRNQSLKEIEETLENWLKMYEKGEPIVSDEDFDALKSYLEKHHPESEFLKKIGNTPRKNKEQLPYILGSLKNKTIENLDSWLLDPFGGRTENGWVLSHKMDGVAILCKYDNKKLVSAWLRGDHIIGENITSKARKFLPPSINCTNEIYLKGEILFKGEPSDLNYKNKRNAVAGILNRIDNANLDRLYVIFHTWANPPISHSSFYDEIQRLEKIKKMVGEENVVRYEFVINKDSIIDTAKKLYDEKTDYDKDGIVITVNRSDVENVKIPNRKIALKFNNLVQTTTVTSIEWNVTRTGKIVPVINFEPVDLGGATITKCSGFNARFILNSGLAKGSVIQIVRSGDVIPYIQRILTRSKPELIDRCPKCKSRLTWDKNKVHIICVNSECESQMYKRITHFFISLGLKQFNEKMLSSLECESIKQVYNITKEDIMKVDGWGEKSAEDFLNQLSKLKDSPPEKILAALGINGLGIETARLLIKNFTFDEILKNIEEKPSEEFIYKMLGIQGLASKKIHLILSGLASAKPLLEDLKEIGMLRDIKDTPQENKFLPLHGKSFCITGSLSISRKEFEKIIENYGGIVTSANRCDFLIANEQSNSNKYSIALKRKIPIITEKEFYEMINKK